MPDFTIGQPSGFIPQEVIARSFPALVAGKYYTGKRPISALGERIPVTTEGIGNDIWEGSAILIPVPDQSAGEQMAVVSTNAQDNATGTGVRKVNIEYLDANGNEQSEEITLNGLTPVNTVATTIRFVNTFHSTEVGSFGAVAAGDITLYRLGTPTRIYHVIKAGGNKSLNSQRMIPVNKDGFISGWKASVTGSQPMRVRLRSTSEDDYHEGVFIFKDSLILDNSVQNVICDPPIWVPPLTVIKITAWALGTGGRCSASWRGWYE